MSALDVFGVEIEPELFGDEGVEAARNACVAGASLAAALITAAAYYENPFTGTPALRSCMRRLAALPLSVERWATEVGRRELEGRADVPFSPGFGFVAPERAELIRTSFRRLVQRGVGGARCSFFLENQSAFTEVAGPLNATGLSALLFIDRALDVDTAERRFLLWRAEAALIAADKSRRAGLAAFSFLSERHVYEGHMPAASPPDLRGLMRRLGLDSDD